MAFAGWIKFSPRLGFQAGTPIIITALMGLGTVYFLLSHGRWASHILTQAAQVSPATWICCMAILIDQYSDWKLCRHCTGHLSWATA